jgi:hypothetical protein
MSCKLIQICKCTILLSFMTVLPLNGTENTFITMTSSTASHWSIALYRYSCWKSWVTNNSVQQMRSYWRFKQPTKSLLFVKLWRSLQCSQKHTTEPYPGPIKSITLTLHIFGTDFNTALPSRHMWSLPLRVCPKLCKHFSCTTSVLQLSTHNNIPALMTITENTLNM